ncbi:MAG TPA: hypothetical protein ENH94_02835 [Phycisphaerales bacterium]|nr:hypothetical protein [Phycisphaerales bacterium]
MAKRTKNRENQEDLQADAVVRDYAEALGNESKMLVVLKSQLYSGSWDTMVDDLNNRLKGKPYIFKLTNRINDDVARIEELRSFEKANGVDLADYVELT